MSRISSRLAERLERLGWVKKAVEWFGPMWERERQLWAKLAPSRIRSSYESAMTIGGYPIQSFLFKMRILAFSIMQRFDLFLRYMTASKRVPPKQS